MRPLWIKDGSSWQLRVGGGVAGEFVGFCVGVDVGFKKVVGASDKLLVGEVVGRLVGASEGFTLGSRVVGASDGGIVG